MFGLFNHSSLEPLCGNLGGGDFVSTIVAINIAVEYWNPIKSLFDDTKNRIISLGYNKFDSLVLSDLDNKEIDLVSSGAKSFITAINKFIDHFMNYSWKVLRLLALVSVITSLFILYLDIQHWCNIWLSLPIVAYIVITFTMYMVTYTFSSVTKCYYTYKLGTLGINKATDTESSVLKMKNLLGYKAAIFPENMKYGGELISECLEIAYLKKYIKRHSSSARKKGIHDYIEKRIQEIEDTSTS